MSVMDLFTRRTPSTEGAITMTAQELLDAVQQPQGFVFRLVDFPNAREQFTVRPHRGEWPLVLEVDWCEAEDDLPECIGIAADDKPGMWYGVDPEESVTVLKIT